MNQSKPDENLASISFCAGSLSPFVIADLQVNTWWIHQQIQRSAGRIARCQHDVACNRLDGSLSRDLLHDTIGHSTWMDSFIQLSNLDGKMWQEPSILFPLYQKTRIVAPLGPSRLLGRIFTCQEQTTMLLHLELGTPLQGHRQA